MANNSFKPKRPEDFHGDEKLLHELSFTMRSYVAASGVFPASTLRNVEGRKNPFTQTDVQGWARRNAADLGMDGPGQQQAGREATVKNEQLFHALAMICKSSAMTIVRHSEEGNGLETWRQLTRKYDRRDDTSSMGLLQSIMNFDFDVNFDLYSDT